MRPLAIALSVFLAGAAQAADVSNPAIGYTITLPQHWGLAQQKTSQDYFRDSTRVRHSQISILRYDIDNATYPTPESWTEAQFIAYKLSVETSAYPFGAVMYYDSSSAAKIGAIWSPEAYSVLYPADGDPTYCEYVRYCAVGKYGYEIYAIGDSTDMTDNLDFYAGIIASLTFSNPAEPIRIAEPALRNPAGAPAHWFDATGRVAFPARRDAVPGNPVFPRIRKAESGRAAGG